MKHITVIDTQPAAKDIDIVQQGVSDFNASQLNERPLEFAIYLKDDQGKINGGITAFAFSDSIHIALLWVSANLRGQGYGSLLIKAAEDEAIKRNLKYAYVDTFSFQAEHFYRKHGYEMIGKVQQALLGHSRLFFRKTL